MAALTGGGCVQVAGSREEFFERSDVVSLHLRLKDVTRGVFEQIVAFAAGSPTNVVNPDVLERLRHT